jgi:hypothetical protein
VHFYGTQDQEAKTSDELAHAMAKIKTIAVDNHATVQQQQVNLQKGMSAMSGKVTALQSEIAKRVTECRVCIRAGGGGDKQCSFDTWTGGRQAGDKMQWLVQKLIVVPSIY